MKILVIEDDSSIRNVLRMGLEAKSFAVDLAEDGDQGSFMARTNDYDLIILDNVLPQKMGGRVCKEIRESGKHMPIIMLSAKSEVITKVELLNLGADDYLTKPFSFEELLARMNALLRRPKRLDERIIKFKDFKLNRDRQTLEQNGKDIYLTRKEFNLLEYLLVNKSVIMSRGQIQDHVWDIQSNPFSNTIETHILNIRKKIGDKNKTFIESIPGRGYRINSC
jgi:DNA-binding response OmpR family regulator